MTRWKRIPLLYRCQRTAKRSGFYLAGREPTLLGLEFYRRAVALQAKMVLAGR